MKKILISISIIGGVAALAITGTIALFNDTETSAGNIFTAGSIDLKVDHLKQTYNDADCRTCSVTVISDTTNMVVEKNDVSITPYPAVFVGSNPPHFIHSAWTAQNDPTLSAANAEWIWATDPTTPEDALNGVIYKFRKTFEWWGPVTGSDLWFAVGSDNGVEVWLNGVKIGENLGQYGYLQGSMLHIPGTVITSNVVQGINTLEFRLSNWPWPNGTYSSNPGGLIYKFSIDGLCGDNYFKTHCTLWGEKDLAPGDYFWQIDDVKPGDHGTNVVSMHVFSNDAFGCLLVTSPVDNENTCVDSEVGDTTCTSAPTDGELSQFINMLAWNDLNQNGIYEPGTEGTLLLPANTPIKNLNQLQLSLSGAGPASYIGLAWCVGMQTVAGDGAISCSGTGNQDIAQTDSFLASLTAYAEQQRNNTNFSCANVQLEIETLINR